MSFFHDCKKYHREATHQKISRKQNNKNNPKKNYAHIQGKLDREEEVKRKCCNMYRNSLLIINKCSISGSWCSSTAFEFRSLIIFGRFLIRCTTYTTYVHVWRSFCDCAVAVVTEDNERINLHLNGRRQIKKKKTLHNLFSSERTLVFFCITVIVWCLRF